MSANRPMEANEGGPTGVEPATRLTGYKLLGLALLVVLLVQAAFVSSYVGALHDPKPRDLQVGVVGPAPLATAVAKQVGFELVPYASEAAARDAIDHRTIEGAFIGAPGGSTLLVVPAAARPWPRGSRMRSEPELRSRTRSSPSSRSTRCRRVTPVAPRLSWS